MRASHYYMLNYKRQQYRVVKNLYSGTNLATSLQTYFYVYMHLQHRNCIIKKSLFTFKEKEDQGPML
jgi:hypothetical protein